jgi:hypothetical protein
VRAAAESSRTRASMGSGGHVTLPARRWMCVAELFGMLVGFPRYRRRRIADSRWLSSGVHRNRHLHHLRSAPSGSYDRTSTGARAQASTAGTTASTGDGDPEQPWLEADGLSAVLSAGLRFRIRLGRWRIRVRPSGCSRRSDRSVDRRIDLEDVLQASDAEQLHYPVPATDHGKLPTRFFGSIARGDQGAQTRRIEERNCGQVDHHDASPGVEQLSQLVSQLGGREDVDLACDVDDTEIVDSAGRHREIHQASLPR